MELRQHSVGTQGGTSGIGFEPDDPRNLIPFETLSELQIIAQRIGGDFDMSVEIGKAGGGSYFDTVKCKITLDPLHILKDPGMARFVAFHEGSHRAITLSPEELGLSEEQIESLYKQIGFGYIQNVIEDGGVNDWGVNTAPGMEEDTRNVYDKQFADPKAILSSPEVVKVAQQLGYWPRFAQFGSEILRDWHAWRKEIGSAKKLPKGEKGRFAPDLDPAVEEALNKALDHAHEAISAIPSAGSRDPDEIKLKHQKRFKICAERVFKEAKKLVALDLDTEMNRQTLNDIMQKLQELQELQEQMQQQQQQGQQGQQSQQGQGQGQQQPSPGGNPQSGGSGSQQSGQEEEEEQSDDGGQQQSSAGGSPQSGGNQQPSPEQQQASSGTPQQSSNAGSQPQPSGKSQSAGGTPEEMQQRKEELEEALEKYNALPEETKKEIQDAIDSALEEEASETLKDLQDKAQKIKESKEKQEQLEAQGRDAEAKVEELKQEELKQEAQEQIDNTKASDKAKAQMKQALDEASDETSTEDLSKDEKLKDDLKKDLKDQKTKEGALPYPEQKLSEETKEAIKDLKEDASPEEQEARQERAEKELKKFEDKANKAIESKLKQKKAPSHEEQANKDADADQSDSDDAEESDNDADQDEGDSDSDSSSDSSSKSNSSSSSRNQRDLDADADDFERIRKGLTSARRAEMSQFEKGQKAVKPYVQKVVKAIRKAMHLTEEPDFEPEQETGPVDLDRAMQGEADPNLRRSVFKELEDPLKLDHAFIDLFDVSTSMDENGKNVEAFKAAILNATVFHRLKIPYAQYSYSDVPYTIKTFKDKFTDPEVKARIGSVLNVVSGTNDAYAVNTAYEEILKRKEKFLFIRVFTDADSGQASALKDLVERIKKEKRVVIVHYGLGPRTEDKHGIYPFSHPNLKMTVTAAEKAKGIRAFIDVLPETTEEMLKHPAKYFGYKEGEK